MRRNVGERDEPATSNINTSNTEEAKPLKNKPKSSRLRQQKLPAWQPILTAFTAIPTIFCIAAIFIPLGVVLLLAADSVQEINFEYHSCPQVDCSHDITLTEDLKGNVYFYYGLDNYFQNHRRYVRSRSDDQLAGVNFDKTDDCRPYDQDNVSNKTILPCGAIANSMFNDTFEIVVKKTGQKVPWTYEGVVWDVDKNVKYSNKHGGKDLCTDKLFEKYAKPNNWKKGICELDLNTPSNNGLQNVDFIIWMRTAALPSFRKLYRILDTNVTPYENGLPKGVYQVRIKNNYNVSAFNGKKRFIMSTTSWAGGNNRFLGISYIVIGSICVALGAVFTFIHLKFGHSFAELADLTTAAQ